MAFAEAPTSASTSQSHSIGCQTAASGTGTSGGANSSPPPTYDDSQYFSTRYGFLLILKGHPELITPLPLQRPCCPDLIRVNVRLGQHLARLHRGTAQHHAIISRNASSSYHHRDGGSVRRKTQPHLESNFPQSTALVGVQQWRRTAPSYERDFIRVHSGSSYLLPQLRQVADLRLD